MDHVKLKHRFFNFVSISLLTHLCLVGAVFLFIPKHEKFIPIEIHFGDLGSKGTGAGGAGNSQAHFKKASAPLPVSKAIVKQIKILRPQKIDPASTFAVPSPTPTSNGEVSPSSQKATAIGGLSSSAAGDGTVGKGNGQSGMGGSGEDTPLARYVQRVVLLIESHKNYPSRAKYLGQEGVVSLRITINREGKILESSVMEAPPFKLLVTAASNIITEIGSFPPMPAEVTLETLTLNVPIRYRLVE